MTNQPNQSKLLSKLWAASLSALRLCILSLVALLIGFTLPVKAEGLQTMIYEVYAGGIHAVQARLDMDFTKPGRYDLVLSAKTRGFLGRLAPWNGTFESHGWVNEDRTYQPQQHKSITTWRDETEIKDYKYTKTGGFEELIITDHDKPAFKKDIEPALTKGTTDALTAALQVFQSVSENGACTGGQDVFDGKRRFKQEFTHEEVSDLTASRYNIYEGDAAQCVVEVTPVAGKWHEKPRGWMSIQEQGRERGTMPTLWVAKLSENGPAVPVKIRVKTEYGTLFMHLVEYRSGDTILIADNRSDE